MTDERPDYFEPMEEEPQPRRAASAEFNVQRDVGSQALLREAMDPANQSLAEALRLSFRVLQVVIVVLVVLFIFSGFQTVEEGQSGVQLRWGRILGDEPLEPGLQFSKWPYPAGEFVLFRDRGRAVDVGQSFWPRMKGTFEQAVGAASRNDRLRPGPEGLGDGSVLARGGDIAHMLVEGSYDIDDPVRFVYCVEDDRPGDDELDADLLVKLALKRATVHAAANRSLQEIVEFGESGKEDLRDLAQDVLDAVNSGIRLRGIETPADPMPALAIKRAFDELQAAKVLAEESVERARRDKEKVLIDMAGQKYGLIVDLIREYETASDLGDVERVEAVQARIDAQLESEETTGNVSAIIQRARAYRTTITQTLGREASRFASVRERYVDQPELVINQLWMEAYGFVLSQPDVEIFRVPGDGGRFDLSISGQDSIRQERRRRSLQARERQAILGSGMFGNQFIRTVDDYFDGPGRQLDASGGSLQEGR